MVFTFDVQQKLPDAEAKVELSVADRDLREVVVKKIKIPIRTPLVIAPATGNVRAKSMVNVLESPDASARVVSRLLTDQRVALRGKVEGFYRVQMEDECFGFVRTADASTGSLDKSVFPRIAADLGPVRAVCASGDAAAANRELQTVKRKYGYR